MKAHYKSIVKVLGFSVCWVLSSILCAIAIFVGTFYYYTGSPEGFFKFFRTLHIVETQYAGSIDKSALLDGALEGMVDKLHDRHSIYLDGDKYKSFSSMTSATYGGIGVYMRSSNGQIVVDDVIHGEPADLAGIQRCDIIVEVDHEIVQGQDLAVIAQRIRGQAGSTVELGLLRDGADFSVTLERKQIHMQTVAGKILPGTDIGYIRVAIFSENTGEEFTDLYQSLREQGMHKLILDLRNNPGGIINQALAVANNFLPENTVLTSYVDRQGEEIDYTADGTSETLPMVVLINENTASSAEIVAGAVQDLQLGNLVGVKSYGKGTVQGIYHIDDANAVKITVAQFKTSKGRIIDGVGIEPDVVVPLQPNDQVDHQFAKAIELLNQWDR